VQVYAVEPGRPQYKPKKPVRVVADIVWLDDGYMTAKKGEIIKVDEADFAILTKARQVTTDLEGKKADPVPVAAEVKSLVESTSETSDGSENASE
jgi:hypothetical protein